MPPMSKPRTLRCYRYIGSYAIISAVCISMGVNTVHGVLVGAVREEAVAVGAVLILLGVLAIPVLRVRTIVDESGVTVVSPYRRRHFHWDEITEISAYVNFQVWFLQVCSSEHEGTVAFFPVPPWAIRADDGDRFHEPSGQLPLGLYKLHANLWEEWQRRIGLAD